MQENPHEEQPRAALLSEWGTYSPIIIIANLYPNRLD